jgi:hypothetical protein
MALSSKNYTRRRAVQVNRLGKDRGRIESGVAGVKPIAKNEGFSSMLRTNTESTKSGRTRSLRSR